jgi:hypothetical protein
LHIPLSLLRAGPYISLQALMVPSQERR